MALLHRYQSTMHGNYKKFILLFGPVAAIALILSVIARYYFFDPIVTPAASWTDNVVLAICLVVFTLLYRTTLPEKKVTFKELFLLTVGISCVAAVLYGLYLWYYGTYTDPEFLQRFKDCEEAKLSPEDPEYQKKLDDIKAYNIGTPAFLGFFLTVVTSFILGFFVALLFKTEKSPLHTKK